MDHTGCQSKLLITTTVFRSHKMVLSGPDVFDGQLICRRSNRDLLGFEVTTLVNIGTTDCHQFPSSMFTKHLFRQLGMTIEPVDINKGSGFL